MPRATDRPSAPDPEPRDWRAVGLELGGLIAVLLVDVAGVALGSWPIGGGTAVIGAAALVAIAARAVAGFAPAWAVASSQVSLGGVVTAFVLGVLQTAQAVVGLGTAVPRNDAGQIAIAAGLAVAALVALVGATDLRPWRVILAAPWRRADGATRVGIGGGVLDVLAWLALVGLSGSFGVGFIGDARPAIGVAAVIAAAMALRATADPALAGRGRGPAVAVALVAAVVAVVTLAGQLDAYLQVADRFPDRFGPADTASFLAHAGAIAILVIGVGLAAIQRLQAASRRSATA